MHATYQVVGMTCGHCRSAVLEEVGAVTGVDSVEVDLATGRLDVSGEGFTAEEIGSAVSEAGYQLS